MTVSLLLGVGGVSAVVLIIAALLMLRFSDTDVAMASRFEAARGKWVAPKEQTARKAAPNGMVVALQKAITELGRAVMQSGVLPGRTRDELQQTLSAAGFRGPNAMALFVGSKLSMLFGLPLAAWLLAQNMGMQPLTMLVTVLVSGIFGLVGPDMIIQRKRQNYLNRLDNGLSDALDLMVICAQAGLSLEPAMARVSVELRNVHTEICQEFATTVRELEMMSDSAAALANLGKRTGLESLMRLTSTLTQTMQYGTPLTDSLRTLSNEMRTASLTKFEERAARLPVMLTLPMIAFILPCVFMIVGGPAAIQIGRSLAN
jgi:tight adherence protein C